MKMYLLSDNADTYTGMRLAGVGGEVIHTREEFADSFAKAAARDDVGIVLVTEKLAGESEDIIREYVKSNARPLVTVIPDRHAGEKEVPGKW